MFDCRGTNSSRPSANSIRSRAIQDRQANTAVDADLAATTAGYRRASPVVTDPESSPGSKHEAFYTAILLATA